MNEKYFKIFVADLNKASTLSFKEKVKASCKIIKVIFTKEIKEEPRTSEFEYVIIRKNSSLLLDKSFNTEEEAVNFCLLRNYARFIDESKKEAEQLSYVNWVRTASGVSLRDYELNLVNTPLFTYLVRRKV
jgi:hypothetical protein